MKTMITFLFSAFCIVMANAQTEDKENAMLNNGIKFLDIPYVAHTIGSNRWRRRTDHQL